MTGFSWSTSSARNAVILVRDPDGQLASIRSLRTSFHDARSLPGVLHPLLHGETTLWSTPPSTSSRSAERNPTKHKREAEKNRGPGSRPRLNELLDFSTSEEDDEMVQILTEVKERRKQAGYAEAQRLTFLLRMIKDFNLPESRESYARSNDGQDTDDLLRAARRRLLEGRG